MSRLLAVFVLLAASALAVDVNLAWDNPEAGTYDGVRLVIENTNGKTNTIDFAVGTTNATVSLPRASVQRLYVLAWADVLDNPIDSPARIYSEPSNVIIARVPGSPVRFRGRLR